MTKTTPTWGYSDKEGPKLFNLEEGEKLPVGFHDAPKADLKDGAVTPPDSTSLRQIPAPEVHVSEKDFSENPNEGPTNYTSRAYPHIPGDSDIHADDENHDGLDGRRPEHETFNKPVTPRDDTVVDEDGLNAIITSKDKNTLDAYAKSKGVNLDKRKGFDAMLAEYRSQK